MAPRALLLDCFGTLVAYDPSRTAQGYEHTYNWLRMQGYAAAYESFLASFDVLCDGYEQLAEQTLDEYSMTELATTYLMGAGLSAVPEDVDTFVELYLGDWRTGISSIPGVAQLLETLRREHRIVVVTNTHEPWFPADVLDQFDLLSHVDALVTSIQHGKRKPHASIFEVALEVAEVGPEDALFVGDSRVPDYEGPRAVGIDARLIDPAGTSGVPDEHRLQSVLDLARLASRPEP